MKPSLSRIRLSLLELQQLGLNLSNSRSEPVLGSFIFRSEPVPGSSNLRPEHVSESVPGSTNHESLSPSPIPIPKLNLTPGIRFHNF